MLQARETAKYKDRLDGPLSLHGLMDLNKKIKDEEKLITFFFN